MSRAVGYCFAFVGVIAVLLAIGLVVATRKNEQARGFFQSVVQVGDQDVIVTLPDGRRARGDGGRCWWNYHYYPEGTPFRYDDSDDLLSALKRHEWSKKDATEAYRP